MSTILVDNLNYLIYNISNISNKKFLVSFIFDTRKNMENELKTLGLNDNEIKVYLSLLKQGETSVGAIINDTALHRQSVYNTLDDLIKKDFVVKKIKNKIHHFQIASPGIMVERAKNQEMIALRLSKKIATEIKKSKHEHEINVYDGREKIRKFFLNRNNNFVAGSTLYVISNYADKYEKVMGGDYLVSKLNKAQQKRKIKVRIISSELYRAEFNDFLNRLGSKVDRKIKFIPDDLMPPVATEIWKTGMSYLSFTDEWFVIEIKNKTFYEPYIRYFNALWEIAKN